MSDENEDSGMSVRRAVQDAGSWAGTPTGKVTVAAAVTFACGVIGPLVPAGAALLTFGEGWSPDWLNNAMDAALVVNGIVFAVAGPWAFYRASRALRPSVGTPGLHTARRLSAATGLAYGALALTLFATLIVGTPILGMLLGLPTTFHLLTLTVYGPLAVVVGLLSLVLTGMDCCASTVRAGATAPTAAHS